jgi:transcriptional regulator of acetoin/glycerol metabolism
MLRLLLEADESDTIALIHCRGSLSYLSAAREPTVSAEDVVTAVANSGNNISQAASVLGVARTTVYRKLREAQRRNTAGES